MQQIAGFLSSADVIVMREGDHPDVLVVLLAPGIDSVWAHHPNRAGVRAVPVLIERTEQSKIPDDLTPINWVRWLDLPSETALASVLVAVSLRSDSWNVMRRLHAGALAWNASGHRPGLLADDRSKAAEYEEVLAAVVA